MRPLAAGVWMAVAGVAVVGAIWLTTGRPLYGTGRALARDTRASGHDRAMVRVEVVRTGLAAGAGVGAAAGLMLGFRRQRHQELATASGEHDAAERRITDLYNAADEQLGSEKAPVRLTAQRILATHLRPGHVRPVAPRFWSGTEIALTGATFIDLDLTGCEITNAVFDGATFAGDASFREVTLRGDGGFEGATFHRDARFDNATFTGKAVFHRATVHGKAGFDEATFNAGFRRPQGWRLADGRLRPPAWEDGEDC